MRLVYGLKNMCFICLDIWNRLRGLVTVLAIGVGWAETPRRVWGKGTE
jgi:hypothetical protein